MPPPKELHGRFRPLRMVMLARVVTEPVKVSTSKTASSWLPSMMVLEGSVPAMVMARAFELRTSRSPFDGVSPQIGPVGIARVNR